jgi:nucleoid-associated protein YgaU
MVTMEAGRSMVVMTDGRARLSGGQIRTSAVRQAAGPVRLTRRGRVVVTGVAALIIGLASVALATAAQATHGGAPTSPGRAGAPGRYVTEVVVRSGQSLWTLAEAHDPNADTRLVIADIERLNSLTTDQLYPGETLWVPRD